MSDEAVWAEAMAECECPDPEHHTRPDCPFVRTSPPEEPVESSAPGEDKPSSDGGSGRRRGAQPTRAEVEAMLPKALALVESQGGYADAEFVDRMLGPTAVAALLLEASRDGRVEAMGGFLIRSNGRRR